MQNVFYSDTKKSKKKSLYILQIILNAQIFYQKDLLF